MGAVMSASLWAQDDDVISSKPVHYINLSPKIGYALGFDNLGKLTNADGTPLADTKLFGGGGAGLGLEYELEAGHFLFNVGLDFDWTHAANNYNIQLNRPMTSPYSWDYLYRFMGYRENREIMTVGLPVRLGAQFGNFYFLLGAKVGYPLMGSWKGSATGNNYYQVTAIDPIQPGVEIGDNSTAGLGRYDIAKNTPGFSGKLNLKPLDVRAMAEFGIDLDEWLQAPMPKKKPKIKKGQKYKPFTKHDIHYRLGFFAEYGVLSINNSDKAEPFAFNATENLPEGAPVEKHVEVASANTVLSERVAGLPSLNNLFAGVKFTVQFAMPEKIRRPGAGGQAVPPATLKVNILDKETLEPVPQAFVSIKNLKSGKMSLRGKEVRGGKHIQRFSRGMYELSFSHMAYYPDTIQYESNTPGAQDSAVVYLLKRPVLKVHVVDAETGAPLVANVKIHHVSLGEPLSFDTDSESGRTETQLADGDGYVLTIDVKGYEPFKQTLASIGENVEAKLSPIKVGKTFVLKNMFFATNKTKILPESEPALEMLYEYMIDEMNATRRIKIVGHTDNVGKDAANQKLSEGRAKAVREALIERGIDGARIEAEGKGESQPIDTNDTEEGRQNNRRVEIVVLE